MLRQLLVAVLLLSGAAAFAQGYIDPACADAAYVEPLLDRIVNGTPTGGPTDDSVNCNIAGVDYEITVFHVLAGVSTLGGAYGDGILEAQGGDCSVYSLQVVICAEKIPTWSTVGEANRASMYFLGTSSECRYYGGPFGGSGTGYASEPCMSWQATVNSNYLLIQDMYLAYGYGNGLVFREPLNSELASSFASGEQLGCEEWLGECAPGVGGGGGGGDGGGTTGPYCQDGSTPDPDTGLCGDGSPPSDDRPTDAETSCWVLDIPCNFRRLFVPREGWGQDVAAVAVVRNGKVPFGFADWLTYDPGDYDAELLKVRDSEYLNNACPTVDIEFDLLFTNHVEGPVTFSFCDVEAFVWWHEVGRVWLWYLFLAFVPMAFFRRVMQ